MKPDEIKTELEIINNRLSREYHALEASEEIIPIYYLINKWTRTSPINAINLENKKALDNTISFLYHSRLNLHMWNMMVETGKKSKKSPPMNIRKED